MTLTKEQMPALVLPSEAVEVPELGGSVRVTGLLLRDRLAIFSDLRDPESEPAPGEKFRHVAAMLAASVVDAAGQKLYTEPQWEMFGAVHFEAALKLYVVAKRLSGLASEDAKKN